MTYRSIHLFSLAMLLIWSLATSQQNQSNTGTYQLLTTPKQFESGTPIVLKFTSNTKNKPDLYCSNSYGSLLITPLLVNDTLQYKIPATIYRKSGIVTWKLLTEANAYSGCFHIAPKVNPVKVESYIGPPSIEAGTIDYSMVVVIPTDANDNPLKDSTLVTIKRQFLDTQKLIPVYTSNLFAYKIIYSEINTGRILISSESKSVNSKEFTVDVVPAIPTNFTISYERNHDYADNNQFTTFMTSQIRDRYNNIVSDATFVDFFITDTNGNRLKATGLTVNGVAKAKMIHPSQESSWQAKAFIEGMAESNTIALSFKQVVKDYNIIFSENNRLITVGPLQSFMKQIIPDGFQIKLSIYNGDTVETFIENTYEGLVRFKLNKDQFPNGNYNFKFESAGIEKTFQDINVW